MDIPPVGSTATQTSQLNNALGQDDFIELFLTQLRAQDPLEPVNNQDFLAQMAQFSLLESNRVSNEELASLRALVEANQGIGLIGKVAETQSGGQLVVGEVISVGFETTGTVVSLKVTDASGEEFFLNELPVSQLTRVYNDEN
ncbi:flagellar basal body rod modification protein [Grimontia celer]|uniref:Basal-body rod modification protein FlgD n=1 Tax=Grimontia celer TaxID=1796497 RepID=A0A128F8N4_9GAMM|nr:flagellar hook capping FlgD N-terminal domain-containing protein [Grimontia celer]CZF82641.1 flagellar basal body rod modification protein [Grimontia celer]